MAEPFSTQEWEAAATKLHGKEQDYGIPARKDGSLVFGSWNLVNFGSLKMNGGVDRRSPQAMEMIARYVSQCNIFSIQEILRDLESVHWLVDRLNEIVGGEHYRFLASDITGDNPGHSGKGERLAFVWDNRTVSLGEIASDITFDRKAVLENFQAALTDLRRRMIDTSKSNAFWKWTKKRIDDGMNLVTGGTGFTQFVRSPYLVKFVIDGEDSTYEVACVDAHNWYGPSTKGADRQTERQREFFALLEWLVYESRRNDPDAPVFMLMADLNLDFESSHDVRRKVIAEMVTDLNKNRSTASHVNFPFLDKHPKEKRYFLTNARQSETFDHIAFFSQDNRFPWGRHNCEAGPDNPDGYDYGMFDFQRLFANALHGGKPTDDQLDSLRNRLTGELSDHMPIWVRLPKPHKNQRKYDKQKRLPD